MHSNKRLPIAHAGNMLRRYNTYVSHYKEVECMRLAMEDLFFEYGVDLVMHGHVHGESSAPSSEPR